jgi:hypothetical protein
LIIWQIAAMGSKNFRINNYRNLLKITKQNNMDFYALSGIIGTVFSIATVFLPEKFKSKKLTLGIFTFTIIVLCCFITNLNSKLNRIEKVSMTANELIEEKSMKFTNEGFILATLAFLEQNKDLYPESYKRAENIFDYYKKSNDKSIESVNVSFELEGLLQGIAILSQEKKSN